MFLYSLSLQLGMIEWSNHTEKPREDLNSQNNAIHSILCLNSIVFFFLCANRAKKSSQLVVGRVSLLLSCDDDDNAGRRGRTLAVHVRNEPSDMKYYCRWKSETWEIDKRALAAELASWLKMQRLDDKLMQRLSGWYIDFFDWRSLHVHTILDHQLVFSFNFLQLNF